MSITKSPVGSGKPSPTASARSIKRIMKHHAGAGGHGHPHSDARLKTDIGRGHQINAREDARPMDAWHCKGG
jgi:hypothetical protein